MRNFRSLCCVLFWPAATLAGEGRDDFSRLMAVVPAEPLAVVYLRSPADLLGHALLREILDEAAPSAKGALQAVTEVLDGPTAVTLTGHPLRPDLLGVTISARVSRERDEFMRVLDAELVTALKREGVIGMGALNLRTIGELAFLRIPGPVPIELTIAHRDGFVLASSNRAIVDGWLSPEGGRDAGADPGFLGSEDFKRLDGASAQHGRAALDALVYVNARPILPLLKGFMPQQPPVFEILGLQTVQAVGLTATRSGGSQVVKVTICRSGEPRGLLGMMGPSSGEVTVARLLPLDTAFTIGGRFETAACWLDGAKRILNLVDPDIMEEFEEERAEFQRDLGFDFQADFLGNLAGEWMLAKHFDPAGVGRELLVMRLGDPNLLDGYLQALTRTFKLDIDVSTHRGVSIVRPRTARFSAAYAVLDSYWIIGSDVAGVSSMIDAWLDEKSMQDAPAFRTVRTALEGASLFGYLNVARSAKQAVSKVRGSTANVEMGDAVGAVLERLADSTDAGLALTVRPAEDRLQIVLETRGQKAGSNLWADLGGAVLMPSLGRSRELAKRTVSQANVRAIVMSALIYANNNKGQWPASLAVLVGDGSIPLEALRNPYDGTAPRTIATADAESYYILRASVPRKASATDVVIAEREIRQGEGANFGFADGHAEFVREPRASELLTVVRSPPR